MGAGALAGRATHLFNAQIALGCFENRLQVRIHDQRSSFVANFNHSNRIVWAVIEASFATDASNRINHHFTAAQARREAPGQKTTPKVEGGNEASNPRASP